MPKSLEEIQAEFNNRISVPKARPKEVPIKEETVKSRYQPKKMALVSDIIFVYALVTMGICAIIISRYERDAQGGEIYRFINEKREIILIIFVILMITSFLLRILEQKKEKAIEE